MRLDVTKEELIGIERLLMENRDSGKLQKISGISYIQSITLINKIRKKTWRCNK